MIKNINTKPSACGLFIVLLTLLICSACAPAVDSQGHKETHNEEIHSVETHSMKARSIKDCVKGVAANSITSKQDFTHCVEGTKEALTSFERRDLNNYLSTVSNSELQLLSANILAKKTPIKSSNRQIIDSILTEVTRLSSDKASNGSSNSDSEEDEDDHDHDDHDHGDHDHG